MWMGSYFCTKLAKSSLYATCCNDTDTLLTSQEWVRNIDMTNTCFCMGADK